MDVKDVIERRKSIRKYQNKQVSEEIINELLDAARRAPSAKNTQSHKYYVVKDKEMIDKLKEHGVFKQSFVYDAPLIIVCCANPKLYPSSVDVDDTPQNYALTDLSIASSFMVLRAEELGLGSVFIASVYREKIREVLNIQEEYIIPFVLSIGYPAEEPNPKTRKKLSEIIF
ncbi:MAG: nitroreductase family protein [Nanoarchaeota archaeon]|nr:nitroreductase family protein [Nanoarchaeota archaeon]MBU1269592.1 nitroreductase family protein [Nanoarchaeota archaeon]MBU1603671.1 nitroreductase family protein [Nanoarchaeota archaeon]MBU2443850.1 nitroreductase family protein [Nanoarchaeota archaeon]